MGVQVVPRVFLEYSDEEIQPAALQLRTRALTLPGSWENSFVLMLDRFTMTRAQKAGPLTLEFLVQHIETLLTGRRF